MERTPDPALSGPLGRLRARLAARPDTEHEQALVRLVVGLALGLYLLPEILQRHATGITEPHVLVWLGFLISSAVVFWAILLWPAASPARRLVGLALDMGTLTWCMLHFESLGVPLFLVYVWVTLANGFRFGARYLGYSLFAAVLCFTWVLYDSSYWRGHLEVGFGLMAGLVALSLYVRKLVTQLFEALARAEAANQAKRRFISVVSHEMRTPLNAIIGMADLMRDTSLNREQADMLQTLRSSSRVMLGLVEDVLDFSKIEAGKVVLDKADFDLHALVNSTSRILAAQAAAKGVEFVVSIMPEVPPALRGDPHYLRQVLINLAGNAVKFTERGSVTLHVSAQAEAETAVRLKFSVRDTGIGIPPEAQARIFESFTQADQSTSRRFGGTGLGTTIAKQLVELMGGKIGLESAVGLGSTFWFEVTLDKQAEHEAVGAGELAGARVMLVGFPAARREPLEQALGGWGARPVAVESLDDSVSRLVAEISLAKPYYSILLFAAEDAPRLGQRFRRSAPHPAPPLILAVPREAEVSRFEALSAGFSSVLELPFDKRQLFNVLHAVAAGDEVREGVVRLKDYARRGAAAKGLRVLVADDNPTNREVLGKILERGGHLPTIVADGEQALDMIERERFDAAILDRNMPGAGGIEVLQAVRLMTRARERLPVMILSADVTLETRRDALEAGADAFLSKPIEAARLLEELDALCPSRTEEAPRRVEAAPVPAPLPVARGALPIVNLETLSRLEELGSSPTFVEKLIGVFLADNSGLMARIETALSARNFVEVRSLLHAMKGSAASMGTERLQHACTNSDKLSDAELRLQSPTLLRSLTDELAAARSELERYLRETQRSAG